MNGSFDPNELRAWPPSGGQLAVSFGGSPPDVESIDLGSLVSRAVDSGEKTAALESDPSVSPVSLATIWRHRNAHPYVLLLLVLDKYGESSLEWQPDTLKLTLERDGIELSNSSYTKILAVRTLLMTPSPWRQWEIFHWVCLGLAGIAPNFTYFEEPDLGHLFVGAELMHITDPKRVTGLEIDKFVAAVLKNEGIHFAPAPLDFAQRELSDAKLHCLHCHAIHRDDNDIKCISCGAPGLVKQPGDFSASMLESKKLWEARAGMPIERALDGLPNTGAGNAVYRLLVANAYAQQAHAHMIHQLKMIGGTR